MRQPVLLVLPLALSLAIGHTQAQPADDNRIAREMIQALDAYAVYKMGQFEEAYARYKALAEVGNHQGMLNLANMLAAGEGVEKDPVKALHWYRKAAEDGSAIGMYEVGRAYQEGQGVAADPAQALEWYQRAAEHDSAEAQWTLGKLLHDRGERLIGLDWIQRAAANEQIAAQAFLETLTDGRAVSTTLTDAQRTAVLALLERLDRAAQARDAQALVAALADDARVRVRLPEARNWTDLSRAELARLWQATFDQAGDYHYQRQTPSLLASDDGVLASSVIVESFDGPLSEPDLTIQESALIRFDNGEPRVHALRLDLRRPEE